MRTFSQSALQTYERCPLQYQLRYLLRQPWPAPEQEPVLEHERQRLNGQRFHRLVQQALLGLPLDRLEAQAEALGPPLAAWWRAFRRTQAPLLAQAGQPQLRPEYLISAPLAEGRLVAKLDLLHQQPDRWTIYDWKTEARLPRREALRDRWQTRVYLALAVRVSGLAPEQIRMTYWYAAHPEASLTFDYTQDAYHRDWEAIQRLAAEIAAAQDFPRTADPRPCAWCNYRSYCDRGQQAGNWQDAPADEPDLPLDDLDFDQIAEIAF